MNALFEHSPWVEQRADARPSSGDRHADLMAVVRDATREEQLALIRAHPELAGKAAVDGTLTQASAAEQASAGLDRLTQEEFARFHRLNALYRERFDFPFIICVRLTTKAGILAAMEARLAHDPEREISAALDEIGKITALRLADAGLAQLETRLAHDLVTTEWRGISWTIPRSHQGTAVQDVVIVGGGQSGLAAAFALAGERVNEVLILDENPAGEEGPWVTYARMRTLRTPKHLTSIDCDIPSLTFRAWYEAQFGAAAWERLGKIPRRQWMDYLRWYRRVLELPVRNNARVTAIEPVKPGLFQLSLEDGEQIFARKVVLATGIQGGGEWHVPDFVKQALPPQLYAHTSAAIDYSALAGKRIGVLGIGASAFDNATTALEAGAAEVHVFARRAELPRVNPIRFMERIHLTPRYPALPDAEKYRLMDDFLRKNQPPTTDMFEAAAAWPGFALHLACPWLSVEAIDTPAGQIARVTTPRGTFEFDFLVLSTGLVSDPGLRPELASLAPKIARWAHRYSPPEGANNSLIDAHPYLGPAFELLPIDPADAPLLHGLFAFNYSALASLGLSASALSGLKHALPRLAMGVANQLFLDDAPAMIDAFLDYDEIEFQGVWPNRSSTQEAEAAA